MQLVEQDLKANSANQEIPDMQHLHLNILSTVSKYADAVGINGISTIEQFQSSIYSQICVLKRPSLYIYLGIVQGVKQRQLYC
jgi:hypothetical protein